ncbi:MAG: hypothetical protein K2J90_14530 [Lachnospiraceae bacterium]|nr:hypothetical protein [Lachnospiraceae bacterium]
MRMINGFIYMIIFILLGAGVQGKKRKSKSSLIHYIGEHMHYLFLILFVNSISFGLTFQSESSEIYIKKEGYGGSEQTVGLLLQKEDTTEQFTLQVRPKMLTEEERDKKMKEAFCYLEDNLKGDNQSLSTVTEALDLALDYKEYPFDMECLPEDFTLMDDEGNLRNSKEELLAAGYQEKDLEQGIVTHVTVILWYGENSMEESYEITLFPRAENETEILFGSLKQLLQQEEKRALYQEGFTIPAKTQGVEISKTDGKKVTPLHVLFFGIFVVVLLVLREKENVKKKEQCRRDRLMKSYPWFVNEMLLLMGAGLQVKNVFLIMIEEYEKENKENPSAKDKMPLLEEIKIASHSMELGMSEEQVYYRLGRRLKLPCYIKLMTLLERNVKKGAKGISAVFEQEELAALEERKNLAKRYGEEAGTRLLGPMILLLLVIMLMIMIPAFLSFL